MNVESPSSVFVKPTVISAGAASAALGLLVLAGWHTHNATLVQVHPAFVPMQYNTALGFLLCGAGLILAIFGRLRLAMACGGTAAAIGILTLIEYVFGLNLGLDELFMEHYITVKTSHPGRMAPNTAFNFTLIGFALLLMCGLFRRRFINTVIGFLGWIILTLGIVALLGYVSGVEANYGWGRFSKMAVHTSAGFVFLGTGVVGWAWGGMKEEETAWTWRLPLAAGIGGAIFSVVLWQALITQEIDQIRRTVQLEAGDVKKTIKSEMEFRILSLSRMANRWEVRGGTPRKEWEADARFYQKDFAGYQAIEWVDSSFRVRWIVPLKGNEFALNMNLVFEKRRRVALEAARDKRTVTVTRSIDLVQGGKGFLVYVPVFKGQKFDGFILGVFRTQDLFQSFLQGNLSNKFAAAIYDGEKEIYKGYDAGRPGGMELGQEAEINVRGVTWRVRIWPTPKLVAASRSSLPLVALISGLLLSSLIGVGVVLMRIARRRTMEIRALAARLEVAGGIAKSIGSELNPDDLFDTIIREILKAVPCERCSIVSLVDEETLSYKVWRFKSDIDVDPTPLGRSTDFVHWAAREIYGAKRLVNIHDLGTSNLEWATSILEGGVQSMLFVPILQDGKCIAHITLSGAGVNAFDSDDEELLKVISGHLGPALRSVTLFQEMEERTSHLYIVGEIAKATNSILGTEHLFLTIAREIRNAVPCDNFVIASIDHATRRFTYWHRDIDIELPLVETGADREVIDWFYHGVYEKKLPRNIQDIREIPSGLPERFRDVPFRSHLTIPIIQDDQCIAHFTLASVEVGAFSDAQAALMASIADNIGSAIENARLFQAVEEKNSRLYIANYLNDQIASNLDLNEVLDSLTEAIIDLLQVESVGIYLADEKNENLILYHSGGAVPLPSDQGRIIQIRDSIRGRALETGQLVVIPDIQKESLWAMKDWARENNLHSMVVHPLHSRGGIIGMIYCLSTEADYFRDDDVEVFGTMATQAAVAIVNARTYEALKDHASKLTRSNEELEQFAYIASHDLQEPLRTVAGFAELLGKRYKGKLDSDADEFIEFITDGSKRMQVLISNLLDYSRVGTKGQDFQRTDCGAVFDQAVANLRVAIEESGANITHDPLPTVVADGTQLTQIFQNLIGNSIKFHGEDAPRVHVSAEQNGSEWIFSISDNGIGIEQEFAERIFRIFQRLHTREEFSGTGIGLAFCKKIVERHGGRIWVDSNSEKGSTFRFTLPR